jgi:hypothetical protein
MDASRFMLRYAYGAALLAVTCLIGAAAEAASVKQRAQRTHNIATRISRIDSLGSAVAVTTQQSVEEQAQPPPFALDLLLPFFYNTDPEQASHGKPSLEMTPEARLTWSQRFGALPVRFSALLDASSDRYAQATDANADLILGRLRAQYESGRDDQEWQPFTFYQPSFIFTPTFAKRVDTWNDIGLGIARYIGLDAGFRRVAAGPNTNTTSIWTLGFEVSGARRFRDGGPTSWAVFTNPSVNWRFAERWSLSAELDITYRWYDAFLDRKRRDLLTTPIITLEFQPPEGWLPGRGSRWGRLLGSPLIDLQIYLSRQNSSLEETRFRQWGAGPILRTGWVF